MKRALCIGINNYPNSANNLNGCINDMNDWINLFSSLGFDEIEDLSDDLATIANIKEVITELSELSVAGDDLVITYSGHGTNVYDEDGDEGDGYDEALYVYDGVFVDDEIRKLIDAIPAGVNITFIFDSCFSGTATKAAISPAFVKKQIRYVELDSRARNMIRKKSFLSGGDMKEVLISGCGDYEYSYDAYIGGKYNGAFTYYALKAFSSGISFKEWYEAIREKLPSVDYPQSPGLFGSDENIAKIAFVNEETNEEPDENNNTTPNDGSENPGCLGIFLNLFKR